MEALAAETEHWLRKEEHFLVNHSKLAHLSYSHSPEIPDPSRPGIL